VADFAGGRAGKILFERESLSGNPAQGGEAREGITADAQGSPDRGRCAGCLNPWDHRTERIYNPDAPFPALSANTGGGQNRQAIAFMAGQGAKAHGIGAVEDGSPTLKGCPSGLNQAPSVVYPAIHPTLTAKNATNVESAQRYNGVIYPAVARYLTTEADASPCLDRGQNVVALDCRNLKAQDISSTLQAKENGGYSLNYQNPVVYDARGHGDRCCLSPLIGDHENRVTDYTSIVAYGGHQSSTLDASYCKGTGSRNGKEREFIAEKRCKRRWIVRRLTPTECTRLQGFPDCWGIPEHKDFMTDEESAFWESVRKTYYQVNGKAYRPCKNASALLKWYNKLHTDSAEYKMWGNGIALPCAVFVLGGIAKALCNEAA